MVYYYIEDAEGEQAEYEKVLDALEGMVEQHCRWPGVGGGIHHKFIAANEVAFEVLVEAGRLRRVEGQPEIYAWVEEVGNG